MTHCGPSALVGEWLPTGVNLPAKSAGRGGRQQQPHPCLWPFRLQGEHLPPELLTRHDWTVVTEWRGGLSERPLIVLSLCKSGFSGSAPTSTKPADCLSQAEAFKHALLPPFSFLAFDILSSTFAKLGPCFLCPTHAPHGGSISNKNPSQLAQPGDYCLLWLS